MEAGRLKHRGKIQQASEVANSFGEMVPTWADALTRYCSINPLSGQELFAAQQVQAEVTHKIKMRYTAGLTPKMRLVYAGRVFNFLNILNTDEENYELTILAKEEV